MKIKYGIYLGEKYASIARVENGQVFILKSDALTDLIPVCVHISKTRLFVGHSAYNAHHRKKLSSGFSANEDKNPFLSFVQTLGSDKIYTDKSTGVRLTSVDLTAEVLKHLLSFEKDCIIEAAVITVPSSFRYGQVEAVRQAGKIAGLFQVEIIQEEVAASLMYGIDSIKHQGNSLVFNFRETFSTCLINNGKIIDSEEDNYIGSESLADAIIDKIILPYIKKNYTIDTFVNDRNKMNRLRKELKFYAQDTVEKFYTFEETFIFSDFGDISIVDDEDSEIELNIRVTKSDIELSLIPVFQKAINISKEILKRNNINKLSLDALFLVGSPPQLPVLKQALDQQICKPTMSENPDLVIVKGAALYASTIEVNPEVQLISFNIQVVEDLLFEITENELISSSQFGDYFEQISLLKKKSDSKILKTIYDQLKEYELKS